MRAFTYDALPGRVVFGTGAVSQVAEEIDRMQKKRALLIATRSAARLVPRLTEQLGERLAGVFNEGVHHIPASTVEKALAPAPNIITDFIWTVGGGSGVGLGHA